MRTPKIEKSAGALCGISRVHGDALPEVQDRVIDILVEVGARYKLPYRDIAHMLLICKIESGFNPDAAAGGTSAAGLGQYTDATITEVSKPHISKARLGFTLDLGADSIFDAEHGAYSVLLSFMRSKELAITHFGNEYEKKLYLFHHEGWYFKPTPEHLAMDRPKEVLQIINKSILPFLDPLENLLATSCELSFKLLTKDDQACKGQPFLAIYPSKPSATGLLAKVQGTAQKSKCLFGITDERGCTPPIRAPGLSEVVFVILNREYKELLHVDASVGSEPLVEPDVAMRAKIANDSAETTTGLRKVTHIANAGHVQTGQSFQPHTGDYLWRRPPMELVAAYLKETLNMKDNAAPALVENKRSHIILPGGNQAQKHDGKERIVAIRTGTTISEMAEREKTTAVPHRTAETAIKKKVEVTSAATGKVLAEGLLFPLASRPAECYRTGARAFNSSRGPRRHAGCDLYAPVGTEVRAMADGVILQCYPFYWGTDAIEVVHGKFIVRYGELEPRDAIRREKMKNTEVKRGDVIGKVGQLIQPNGSKYKDTMLHLEMYGTNLGTDKVENRLSQANLSPFERRSDLVDPSDTLDRCRLS